MASFTIPAKKNKITPADLDKGILRITVDFKEYFPSESGEVLITYGEKQKEVSFQHRTGRSHVLHIGKSVIKELKLKPGDHIKFREVKHFVIEKF